MHSIDVRCCVNELLTARKPSASQQFAEDLERLLADVDQLEWRLTGMLQDALPVDVSQAADKIVKYKVCCMV